MYHTLRCANMLLPYCRTDLCIRYTFAHLLNKLLRDCNAFDIQFRTCNRDVNMVAAGDPFSFLTAFRWLNDLYRSAAMALNSSSPDFKTTGDDKHDIKV